MVAQGRGVGVTLNLYWKSILISQFTLLELTKFL